MGYRYSPSRPTPTAPPRVHPPLPHPGTEKLTHGHDIQVNMVVGLIYVEQLTLRGQISDILGMTEVYNLVRIGRINNHYCIPGTD